MPIGLYLRDSQQKISWRVFRHDVVAIYIDNMKYKKKHTQTLLYNNIKRNISRKKP